MAAYPAMRFMPFMLVLYARLCMAAMLEAMFDEDLLGARSTLVHTDALLHTDTNFDAGTSPILSHSPHPGHKS